MTDSTTMAYPASKRRRTSSPHLRIGDLPDPLLASVSSYLVKPSRAIFAAAMASDIMRMAILSGSDETYSSEMGAREKQQLFEREWGVLEFGDIDKDLAAKLTDDDLHDVLTCINAKEYLKTLRLSGCMNINGRGLEPLRASAVLEHIDLSLAYSGAPSEVDAEPQICVEKVIPILDSIVDANGCSLKMVVLRGKMSRGGTIIDDFLDRYGRFLDSRNIRCNKCTGMCRGFIDSINRRQKYTCNQCFEVFCSSHVGRFWENNFKDAHCNKCDRQLCRSCRYTACTQGGCTCKGCWNILGRPIRNMSSFFLYSNAVRNDVRAANPDARYHELGQITARHFRALPAEERAYWDQKAAEDKQRYDRDIALYRAAVFPEGW